MEQNYSVHYLQIWESSSDQRPAHQKRYYPEEKKYRESAMDSFLESLKSFRKKRREFGLTSKDEDIFFKNTRLFFQQALDFEESQLNILFSDEMVDATRAFVRHAKEFDPNMQFNDIFQALRNAWIMNGLQLIMGLPICFTPSVFAYSMLYPYTDNFIDDPLVSEMEKMLFSLRLKERLSGVKLKPGNKTEDAIFRLVEMIETEFSRADFPEVFDSLLMIHEAQTASLRLLDNQNRLSEKEALQICIHKGGTSVLADGFLVAGRLTENQKYFLYGYGAYLQLLDDLQDVDDDYRAGLQTVFSRELYTSPLDLKLNKTYWFGEQVMRSLESFGGMYGEVFKSLMQRSMDLFVAEAIARTSELYSPDFILEFEDYSPFSFDYIRKLNLHFNSYHGFLVTALKDIALSDQGVMLSTR